MELIRFVSSLGPCIMGLKRFNTVFSAGPVYVFNNEGWTPISVLYLNSSSAYSGKVYDDGTNRLFFELSGSYYSCRYQRGMTDIYTARVAYDPAPDTRAYFATIGVDTDGKYIIGMGRIMADGYVLSSPPSSTSFGVASLTEGYSTSWTGMYNAQMDAFLRGILITPTDDPYNPGGTTQPTEIPSGDFDNTTDPIPPAPLPTLSAVDAKFITLFSPDLSQLQSLASYMWGSAFNLDNFKKLFTDPMAAILGLSIVPVTPSVSGATPVTLGNITTTVSMPKVTSQYITVSCGTLNVKEYWGAYLDYSPYTKLEIFLPYIGIQTLDADDIMGRSVAVTYNIDILSGACVAMLTCGNSVLYSFAGSCATSVPITGRDWTNVINGIIGIATGIAGVAVAGATGGAAVAAGAAGGLLSSTANSLSSMKPNVQKSGTMASAAGMLGHQKPYLILTRPRQALPEEQNTYTGYPSYITETLGNLTGYTIVDRIHLSGFYALDDELSEIETLLKSGVIL